VKQNQSHHFKSAFPKLTGAKQTGRMGVEAVTAIVSNELKWLFRTVAQEDDYGIDGYIDIVLEDGSVTGQSIAVQIKAGTSFFQTKTSMGIVFHGERKHLNYYLNNALSVIIILCDLSARKCYYEVFHPDRTDKTATGWRMVVPLSQTFDTSCKPELLRLVGPSVDHSSALEQQWAISKMMAESDLVLYAIERTDIEAGNTQAIEQFFERILRNPTLSEKLQGKICLSVSGYDADKRELWQIRAVKRWFAIAVPRVKVWFYFLSTDFAPHGLILLLVLLSKPKAGKGPDEQGIWEIIYEPAEFAPFLEICFKGLNWMTERLGMSEDENKRISFAVMKVLFPDYSPKD
jgi:hypothetical protein